MRPFLLSVAILLQITYALGQPDLVKFDELTFYTPREKQFLTEHLLERKTDYFNLFMANGQVMTDQAFAVNRQKLYDFIGAFRTEKFKSLKNSRKVKTIYESVNQRFLSTYDPYSRFEDLFLTSSFNALTAAGLFGIIFNELSIPFEIKETADRVYLILYPAGEKIVVEPSSPRAVTTFNDSFKSNYIKILRSQKVINPRDADALSIDALFDKYYFMNQGSLTLLQLAAAQYSNMGLWWGEQRKFTESFAQFEKAFLLNPTERHAYLAMTSGVQAFTGMGNKYDEIRGVLLGKLSRYIGYDITTEMVLGDFRNAINHWLWNNNDRENLSVFYTGFLGALTNEALRLEADFLYQFELGRFFHNQGRFKDAVPMFEKALLLKPANVDAANMMMASAIHVLKVIPNDQAIVHLERYQKTYPVLNGNNHFNKILGFTYLVEFENGYSNNRPADGDRFRQTFEEFYKSHNEIELDEFQVGKSYSSAAVYYFKKGQQTKARSMISYGLQISPNNYELKMRSKMMN